MTTEPVLSDGSMPDPALADFMESPDFQAQMAALTQQAAAQLAALVESLRAAEQQLPPLPGPEPRDDDALAGIWLPPPEPVLLPPEEPKPTVAPGDGEARMPRADLPPFAHATVMPAEEELAADMLAILPPVAPPQPALPAISGTEPPSPAPDPWQWAMPEPHQTGGEGGVF